MIDFGFTEIVVTDIERCGAFPSGSSGLEEERCIRVPTCGSGRIAGIEPGRHVRSEKGRR